jgi:hypothetical protein
MAHFVVKELINTIFCVIKKGFLRLGRSYVILTKDSDASREMSETNVTSERMHPGRRILLALLPCIPLPKTPLIETHYPTNRKKAAQGARTTENSADSNWKWLFWMERRRYSLILGCEDMCLSKLRMKRRCEI